MNRSSAGSRVALLTLSLLAVACGTARPPAETPRPRPAARAPLPSPAPAAELYAAGEALRDVLSGPWEYLGTGMWPGINRMQACAFRNSRVIVVNVYCSLTEAPAFRLDVYSPTRGHVRIYAEADGPLSASTRREYFTFTTQSEAPPGPQVSMAPLGLTMSFDELREYDQRRYEAFLPACYGGLEHSKHQTGCLGALAGHATAWTERNRGFLEHANEDWYRVVRQMRVLAAQYGRDPN